MAEINYEKRVIKMGEQVNRYELHEYDHESGEGKCYEVHDCEPDQGCYRVEFSTDYKDAAEKLLEFLNTTEV